MSFKKLDSKPKSHPKLEAGYTRVLVIEVKASTEKATLFKLDGDIDIWIPRKFFTIHYGRLNPKDLIDGKTVVDIENWLYDKNIKGK